MLVQGKGEGATRLAALLASSAGEAPVGPVVVPGRPDDLPEGVRWAGLDESGKGDYFGPVVSAAVVLDPDAGARLVDAGIRDSKKLSDKRIKTLAPEVREAALAYAVMPLAPPAYNDCYRGFKQTGKSLNHMLAWLHAQSLKAVLHAEPEYAIYDKFATDAQVVEYEAARIADGLRVVQYPRAESDVAVAAASVLAREGFLDGIEAASERAERELPRGTGRRNVEVARELGRDVLKDVAKLHFVTTDQALAG